MKHAAFLFKIFFFGYLGYLLYYIVSYVTPSAAQSVLPFALWVVTTIDLFIHETGHLFFSLFGDWIHALGGSLFQCLLPLALLVVTWRQDRRHIAYPGFWLGLNLVDASIYVYDAPFKRLRLISSSCTHDWNYLLSGHLTLAQPTSYALFMLGILLCAASILVGFYFAYSDFRDYITPPLFQDE